AVVVVARSCNTPARQDARPIAERDGLDLRPAEIYADSHAPYMMDSSGKIIQLRVGTKGDVMRVLTVLLVLAIAALVDGGQQRPIGYSDTPMLPGGRWHVHDGKRPQPTIVKPGDVGTAPPSDAIVFTAPRFKGESVETPAYASVVHNGVVVHNHTAILGTTGHRILASYTPHPSTAPLMLQDHAHPVRYRNIWIRPLKSYDER